MPNLSHHNPYKGTERFVSNLSAITADVAKNDGATFDDAVSSSGVELPKSVERLADAIPVPEGSDKSATATIAKAVMDGVEEYKKRHGCEPGGSLVESAVNESWATISSEGRKNFGLPQGIYDDVTSSQSSAPLSVNPAVISVYQTIAEACPIAGYIPFDRGLETRLNVITHKAMNNVGEYEVGDGLDYVEGGKTFMQTSRVVEATSGGSGNYQATVLHAKNDATGSPIHAGSVEVLVDGITAGSSGISTNSTELTAAINGSIDISGTIHTIGGTVNSATGVVDITSSPALPGTAKVEVEAHINYEHSAMSGKTPQFGLNAKTYDLRAFFTRGIYTISPEAKTQFSHEARIDPGFEAMIAMRSQSTLERHYHVLKRLYSTGKNYPETVSLNAAARQDNRSRQDIWSDVAFALSKASGDMVVRTNGLKPQTLYVGTRGMSEVMALSPSLFVPSGQPVQAGISRIGKLFNLYDVYFAPGLVNETASSIEILCVGKATDIARNPVIFGNVAGPTVLPISPDKDLNDGMGYFQALVTKINPHAPSARAAAVIEVTDM